MLRMTGSMRAAQNVLLQEPKDLLSFFFGGTETKLLDEVVDLACDPSIGIAGHYGRLRSGAFSLFTNEPFEGLPESLEVDRLLQTVVRSGSLGIVQHLGGAPAQYDDGDRFDGGILTDPDDEIQTALAGQHKVSNDEVRPLCASSGEGTLHIRRSRHRVALELQDLGQRMLGVEIVLYNQDGLLHGFPRVWHSVVGVAVNTSGEMNSAWGKALDNRMAPDQRVGFYNNTGRARMQ